MKIKIVGEGKLAHDYLRVGAVYSVLRQDGNCVDIVDDWGEEISVNLRSQEDCGFLEDAQGELHWEIIKENKE